MRKIILLEVVMLVFSITTFSQITDPEWSYARLYTSSEEEEKFITPIELSDGSIVTTTRHSFLCTFGDFYSITPGVAKFSSAGYKIADTTWWRKGYWGYDPYIFETANNELVALGIYNPERDTTYFNYDPEVKHAFMYFYKLDDQLHIIDSVIYPIPLDTLVNQNLQNMLPNEYNASAHFIGSVQEDDYIMAAYYKNVTQTQPQPPVGKDSLFMFKMSYDGEILQERAYEFTWSGSGGLIGHHKIVKSGNYYLFYEIYNLNIENEKVAAYSPVTSFDEELDYVKERNVPFLPNIDTYNNVYPLRSQHNTTYLILNRSDRYDMEVIPHEPTLLEIEDDGISNIKIIKKIRREGSDNWDRIGTVTYVDDKKIYWGYTYNMGFWNDEDSYVVIEALDSDWRVISEVYYDDKKQFPEGSNLIMNVLQATKDGGVIMTCQGWKLGYPRNKFHSTIVKFPAEAFLGIEEAHNHGLKLAVAYPNPGNVALNIRTALQDAVVEVYDVQGRKVAEQAIGGIITTLDTESWPSGMYLWNVLQDGKVSESGKWVKE